MPADNWCACPVCFTRAWEAWEEQRVAVALLYGKIPVREFDRRREALGTAPSMDEWEETDERLTVREDYDIGINSQNDSPMFFVSYSGGCQVCGLSHEFKTTERVSVPVKEPNA